MPASRNGVWSSRIAAPARVREQRADADPPAAARSRAHSARVRAALAREAAGRLFGDVVEQHHRADLARVARAT